jgi:hypothetical protein
MYVVVEQIAEVGDDATCAGIVVVGAENSRDRRIAVEDIPDPGQGILVHFDIRVDEDEDVAARLPRA